MQEHARKNSAPEQLINKGLIAELAGVLPATELAQTMARFAGELVEKHARLAEALEKHDCAAMCDIAHAMTGTCGTFGAEKLSHQCRELLDLCETYKRNQPDISAPPEPGCIADMEERVRKINTCIDETLKALEKALLEQGA